MWVGGELERETERESCNKNVPSSSLSQTNARNALGIVSNYDRHKASMTQSSKWVDRNERERERRINILYKSQRMYSTIADTRQVKGYLLLHKGCIKHDCNKLTDTERFTSSNSHIHYNLNNKIHKERERERKREMLQRKNSHCQKPQNKATHHGIT